MTPPEDQPIGFDPKGPPDTVLDPPPEEARAALGAALAAPPEGQKEAVADVAARFPRWSEAWACLGELSEGIEAYAYFRVGYHRGLDHLRASGWRGTGYVRRRHESNRGFLRAVEGLRRLAGEIGETDEEARCAEFLRQLDPDWDAAGPERPFGAEGGPERPFGAEGGPERPFGAEGGPERPFGAEGE